MIQTDFMGGTAAPADTAKTTNAMWDTLKGMEFDDAMGKIANSMVDFAFKLLIAAIVFYVGKFVIRKLYQVVHSVMLSRKVDASLTTFVLSLIKIVLYFILIVTVIGILGIETSSFLAIFASAGVAIGMALSGTLQNFAGGVLILLLKPYRVGDYIETQGYAGTVKEIQIFSTIINTPDNKSIIIPNGGLSTGSINNYSREDYRRVDWTVSLAYGDDYEKASQVILDMLLADSRVVKTSIEEDRAMRQTEARQEEVDARMEHCKEHPDDEICKEVESDTAKSGRRWWQFWKKRDDALPTPVKVFEKISLHTVKEPPVNRPPFVGLSALADSSINITVRAWTRSEDYWSLFFDMNRRFYKELPEKGFNFPFPQLDVHLSKVENTDNGLENNIK